MGFRLVKNFVPVRRILISRSIAGDGNYLSPVTAALLESPVSLNSKRWHIGHSHHPRDRSSGDEGERIFRLGLAADVGLAAGKAFAGYFSGSTAVIADAAHSISDVVLSSVALFSFKAARIPKDKEHPYGHGKFESLGALGISSMLLVTAGGIAWHAVDVLLGLWSASPDLFTHGHHHGIDMAHPVLAISVTTVSIAVKEGLYWVTKKAGERANSGLMKANAWHHRADAVSSVVALIGVGGSLLGVRFLDPLAGLVVSGMILKAGLQSGYQSVLELVDAAVPSQLMEPYKRAILQVEGVKGCNHLRGRRAGSFLYLDVNVEVDPFSSVSAAHDIGENVRHNIHQLYPEIAEVFIHIEPHTMLDIPTIPGGEDNLDTCLDYMDEETVRKYLSSKFSEKLVVRRIVRHVLQGHVLLQIKVSMPPDVLIRYAINVAEEAKEHLLKVVPNNVSISMQLQLGQTTPPVHQEREESLKDGN